MVPVRAPRWKGTRSEPRRGQRRSFPAETGNTCFPILRVDEPNVEAQADSSLVLGLSKAIMEEAFPYLGITTIEESQETLETEGEDIGETEYTDYDVNYEETYDNPDGSYVDENYDPDLDDWASEEAQE